ncbi:hypothetical protein [Mesorhizobium onobrychidis]|uniref:ATP-binding protein n=1 Tax=Mesorhizobium onobrychidis TaxID=2775404 RepID=A0ABY5QZQ1_9HYPH|nr:hypothetical protein [Mesorhizobium onobrychidis]UVC16136.1 hypothetical protein IHQ72_02825 [Mesorhizobium onobrychidis]
MFNRSESSLDIVWANFGAGKTHFLLHLIEMAKKEAGSHRFLPSYVEVPEQTRQFLDVYRRVLASWPLENVANAIQEFGSAESDLARAAQTYIHGGAAERSLIHDWIGGGRPSLKDLRNASGISTRIDDDIRAAEILSQIISAFAARSQRVMLCLDEFQRLAFGNPKQGQRIMQSIRSLLSANSNWLSVVLGVASRAESTALEILPSELKTLVGIRPGIALPALDEAEAVSFAVERMASFRPTGYSGDPAAPFGADGLAALVNALHAKTGGAASPRVLLQALAWVYDEMQFEGRILSVEEIRAFVNDLAEA